MFTCSNDCYNEIFMFQDKMPDVESLFEYNKIVRKIFDSEDEGREFYNHYTYEKGFSVRKEYCGWDNGKNTRTLHKFVCSCEGFRIIHTCYS
jgi:zinc finger SWIM domain-containing protein 3